MYANWRLLISAMIYQSGVIQWNLKRRSCSFAGRQNPKRRLKKCRIRELSRCWPGRGKSAGGWRPAGPAPPYCARWVQWWRWGSPSPPRLRRYRLECTRRSLSPPLPWRWGWELRYWTVGRWMLYITTRRTRSTQTPPMALIRSAPMAAARQPWRLWSPPLPGRWWIRFKWRNGPTSRVTGTRATAPSTP